MDIREAVQDKANYCEIVAYFKNLNILSMDDMVLLVDTIEDMSEEIFEHYKALCDMCRGELQRIRRIWQEQKDFAFLKDSEKSRLAYIVTKACRMDILLTEKYAEMADALSSYL